MCQTNDAAYRKEKKVFLTQSFFILRLDRPYIIQLGSCYEGAMKGQQNNSFWEHGREFLHQSHIYGNLNSSWNMLYHPIALRRCQEWTLPCSLTLQPIASKPCTHAFICFALYSKLKYSKVCSTFLLKDFSASHQSMTPLLRVQIPAKVEIGYWSDIQNDNIIFLLVRALYRVLQNVILASPLILLKVFSKNFLFISLCHQSS